MPSSTTVTETTTTTSTSTLTASASTLYATMTAEAITVTSTLRESNPLVSSIKSVLTGVNPSSSRNPNRNVNQHFDCPCYHCLRDYYRRCSDSDFNSGWAHLPFLEIRTALTRVNPFSYSNNHGYKSLHSHEHSCSTHKYGFDDADLHRSDLTQGFSSNFDIGRRADLCQLSFQLP